MITRRRFVAIAAAFAPALFGNEILLGTRARGAISTLYPSGAERATVSVPMLPPATGLFSTTACFPHIPQSRALSTRQPTSGAKLAGNGTIKRTKRSAMVKRRRHICRSPVRAASRPRARTCRDDDQAGAGSTGTADAGGMRPGGRSQDLIPIRLLPSPSH